MVNHYVITTGSLVILTTITDFCFFLIPGTKKEKGHQWVLRCRSLKVGLGATNENFCGRVPYLGR